MLARKQDSLLSEFVTDASLPAVREAGIFQQQEAWLPPLTEEEMSVDAGDSSLMADAISFGLVVTAGIVAELSDSAGGGLTRLCLPVLPGASLPKFGAGVDMQKEPMLIGLGAVCFLLIKALQPDLFISLQFRLMRHKAEVKEVQGEQWFHKACKSNRIAVCLLSPELKKGKKKQVYMYLGGGSLDTEASSLLQGIVVLCKSWSLAALMVLAVWVVSSCAPCGPAVFIDPKLVITQAEGQETDDPLVEEEELTPPRGTAQSSTSNDASCFVQLCEDYRSALMSSEPVFAKWPNCDLSPPLEIERLRRGMECSRRLHAFQQQVSVRPVPWAFD